MSFLDIAQNRYATKMYDNDALISDQDIEQLKQILRLSPSSINCQPWKFFFITDQKLKKSLAEASFFNEQKINQATLLVVFTVIDSLTYFENHIQTILPQAAIQKYKEMIKPKSDGEIKSWLQNQVYLSLGFFLAATASMGVDSTPIEGINKLVYNDILKLEGCSTLFVVALGKRHPDDVNQPSVTPKSRLPLNNSIVSM